MPPLGPIKQKTSIARLFALGFEPPQPGGDRAYRKGRGRKLRIPPHREEIGAGLLARILRQAGISRKEWESVR